MSELMQLPRSKLRNPLAPKGYGGDRYPQRLGKRLSRLKVGNGLSREHADNVNKVTMSVKGLSELAYRGLTYDRDVASMGERMKALRLSRGLTLEEMGAIMGVTHSALSQIENGITKNVRLDNFLRFCAYFDADPYFVVFGATKTAATGRFRKLQVPET